jgi:formate hydrogenlyase subunit 3/multisubunit Na+/H+ antiporter MnhD subunit
MRLPGINFEIYWSILATAGLTVALIFFGGTEKSCAAGNLVFYMLLIGFPFSLVGIPFMMQVSDYFEIQNIHAYSSKSVLLVVWLIFFILGLIQATIIGKFWRKSKIYPSRPHATPPLAHR